MVNIYFKFKINFHWKESDNLNGHIAYLVSYNICVSIYALDKHMHKLGHLQIGTKCKSLTQSF
jgi:hypothetical protein